MKYSDFSKPRCPKCDRFADGIVETVLLSTGLHPMDEDDPDGDLDLEAPEIHWDSSETYRDKDGNVELSCSHCLTEWSSGIKD